MFIFFIYIHRVRIFILFDLCIGHQTRLGVIVVMLRAVLKFNCFYCNGDSYFVSMPFYSETSNTNKE